ncbi:MAG TPA: class I adenylate-forming enzyme family protein [Burkholderiales bacterium]|jgi:cyclohexanecarboxylate-CoA ligase|nr:class I adenylate-forming enzyme family protein [Burkholderiales bacterium]
MHRDEREARYRAHGWWADDTLTRWLARHVRERPDAPALAFQDTVLSWKDVERRVLLVAAGLRARGVGPGDVVAVQLPNTPEFILGYLAIAHLGAVTCTLHMPYRGAEVQALMRHSGARLAICLPQSKEMFQGRGFAFADIENENGEPLGSDFGEPGRSDPFLLLYTSGTTAAPKGVVHSYRTMLGNGRVSAPEHGLHEKSRVLCAAPLSHLYGLYSLHCAWAVGACTVLLPAFKPDELGSTVENLKPTALWTAPAHVAACRAAGAFERYDWSSLELAIVSGSIAPPALVRYFAEKLPRCAVTQLWGMTELQAGLYTRPGDPFEMSATSAGRPSPGTEVRLSSQGELEVRGPSLFSGYLNDPTEAAKAFAADGWFRTGDLGEARGKYFAITGRSKDLINRGGVKINPADVEMLLDSHPKVLQSALVPMPDPVLGEKACAFVSLKNPADPVSLEELVTYLMSKEIAKNKLPERLVIVAEMPLTPTRKIIKSRLRIPD